MDTSAVMQDGGPPPLVVDVDGTLLKTDLLVESFFALARHRPFKALGIVLAHWRDKAALKRHIAACTPLDMHTLPLNRDVLELVMQAKADGRKVYLASASDQQYVKALADHTGLFDGVFASDGRTNLSSRDKAKVLCDAFGREGFDYAGDSRKDFAVWECARNAVVVSGGKAFIAKAAECNANVVAIGSPVRLRDYVKAMRVHQWLKNILVFVPMIAAHAVSPHLVASGMLAFLSFSLCASSAYLLNDLLDLGSDRAHPTKQNRVLARGAIPLVHAAWMVPALILLAFALALLLPVHFMAVLALYFVLTVAYSLWIKRLSPLDVMTLACLYGVRILSGVALGIFLSEWLIAFSIFLFLSLALLKRGSEMARRALDGKQDKSGRGYRLNDLPTLSSMASASGYISVLVMALYIKSPEVLVLYTHPNWLWGICIVLAYWVSHIVLLAFRGEMDEDPILFAVKDPVSRWCGLLCAIVALCSI